jgi:hypothetical protein
MDFFQTIPAYDLSVLHVSILDTKRTVLSLDDGCKINVRRLEIIDKFVFFYLMILKA